MTMVKYLRPAYRHLWPPPLKNVNTLVALFVRLDILFLLAHTLSLQFGYKQSSHSFICILSFSSHIDTSCRLLPSYLSRIGRRGIDASQDRRSPAGAVATATCTLRRRLLQGAPPTH